MSDSTDASSSFPAGHIGTGPALSGDGATRGSDSSSLERQGDDWPRIDGYQITDALGQGAMGTVWKAVQLSTKRLVAIKMLREGMCWSERARLRFEREIELAARLDNPNIAQVYDSGLRHGLHYYAMQFVDGRPLDDYVVEEQISVRQILTLMRAVCSAVQHAHQCQVLHRDLKPSNILVGTDGRPYVLDFGLAKALASIGHDPDLSCPGEPAGTPAYMSPEQAAGQAERVDTRTDVYSLGVILYQLITGKFPHDPAGAHSQVRHRIQHQPVPRPRSVNASIDRELEALLIKVLEHDPNRRYESPGAFAHDIDRYLAGEPLAAKPPTTAYFLARRLRKYRIPAAIIGVVATVLFAVSLYGTLRVSQAERTAVQRLARISVRTGVRLADEGDPLGALVWFTGALKLERTDERASNHRVRIATWFRRWPDLLEIIGTGHAVRQIDVSAGGTHVVTLGEGGLAELWSLRSGTPGPTRPWGAGTITAVALDAIARRIAVADTAGAVRTWILEGDHLPTSMMSHDSAVSTINFGPRGERLVTACEDGTVWVWDALHSTILAGPIAHADTVVSASFDPSGRWVLTAGLDGMARVWDAKTGQPVGAPMLHDGHGPLRQALTGAWFSTDGQTVVTTARDREVRLWEAPGGKLITVVTRHEEAVNDVAFSSDGRWFATAGADGAARVWEARHGGAASPWLRHDGPVNRVVFTPDDTGIITACADGNARVWDWRSPDSPVVIFGHGGAVADLAFDQKGQRVFTTGADGTIRIWRCGQDRLRRCVIDRDVPLRHAAFGPAGQRVVTAGQDGVAQLWDVRTGEAIGAAMEHASGQRISVARFGPRGLRVVTAGWDGIARIWDATTGRPITHELEHHGSINDAAFSPDGRAVATAGATGVRVWEAQTGHVLPGSKDLKGSVLRVAFDPDGTRLLAATATQARWWPAHASNSAGAITDYRNKHWVYSAGFSSDGGRVVTAGSGGAWLWDLATGSMLVGPLGEGADVYHASFSADGDAVATAGYGIARVWDAWTGEPITPPLDHQSKVYATAFSPCGRMIATASGNGCARIWDARSGEPITPTLWHGTTKITTIQFSPDSRSVLTVGGNRAVIWNLAPDGRPVEELVRTAELLAGRRIDATGAFVPLDGDQAFSLWRDLKDQPGHAHAASVVSVP